MTISIRSRFILISVSITLLSLILFTSIIYDRAIKYKHQQEASSYRTLAEQFLLLTLENKSHVNIRSSMAKYMTSDVLPAVSYAILDKENNIKYLFERSSITRELLKTIITGLKENNDFDGQLNSENDKYYWLRVDLSQHKNNDNSLLIIYPLSLSVMSEVLEFFGLPFFISGFFLLWVMVWAAIILSSFVVKLQKQKQTLSEQAIVIEQARDDAMQENSAKSNFLANMSHEIRTPLTSIIGFSESCQDVDQSIQERAKAIQTIIKSGKHLMTIINEILDVSKIEAGKIELELIPISVVEILDDINQLISIMAEDKGLTFGINYTYPLPETIISDPIRLKQILINLCSNSIKFTEKGHVYLNVSYVAESSNLIFEVIDTGIGMTPKQKEKIFNPFEQADSSTTRNYGGTGLGLTLSKQLTEMLNGELTVESLVSIGSRFTVTIEIVEVEKGKYIYTGANKDTTEKRIEKNIEVPKLKGKVLLVEDSKPIQDLLKLIIEKVGVELDIVDNGREAVKTVSESHYDLVFMDIQMPIMDGLTAMKELIQKGYKQPVIAMTANAMKKNRDDCNEAGFSNFISKPVDRKELYLLLMTYLKENKIIDKVKPMLTSNLLIEEPELIDLVDKFIARLPTMRDVINQSYKEQKFEALSDLIHQMKGVGGNYGYTMLTELCAKIEFQIENQDSTKTARLIEEFNVMADQIIAGSDENHKIANQAMS